MLEYYFTKKENNLRYFKCSECGYVTSADAKRNNCSACEKEKRMLELLQEETFYLKPLKVIYKRPNSEAKYNRRYVICECKQCGKVEEHRDDAFKKRKGCRKCGAKHGGKSRILSNQESAKKLILKSYKGNAKSRGLPYELDNEYFYELLAGDCYYCGAKPKLANYLSKATKNHDNINFYANGIDRLDSLKGYIKGNVVSCCRTCNMMKRNLHYKHFINIVFDIYKNLKDKK